MKKVLMFAVILAAVFGSVSVSAADENSCWVNYPLEKLGRGVANVAFGPLELLMKPWDVNQNQGAIASLTFGVFKGVAWTIAREVVGVVDIATFLVPLPGCPMDPLESGWGYGPIMRPAWVVDIEHNAYNLFYDDSAIVTAK